MKVPTKDFTLRIGPFDYDVIYSEEVANEENCFGSTHNNEQKIFLEPKRKRQKIEQTLIHEVLHACAFVSGLSYRFGRKDEAPSEEDVVRELSMVFYQVMKDNPKVF